MRRGRHIIRNFQKPKFTQSVRFTSVLFLVFAIALACQVNEFSGLNEQIPQDIDFNRHIKPILSDKCFSCHGPDANSRKANLRLDIEDSALGIILESGGHAFVPGNLKKSKAFQRMLSKDKELQMPPPESNLKLNHFEKALVAKWIKEGAVYEAHWSFQSFGKMEVPSIVDSDWMVNEIDHFVLKKLESKGLQPNEEADKATILRRLSLDLIGLPPSISEIQNFLQDDSASAYEKVVDRLLSSKHFGERMATEWLDVARYADSHGYSTDGSRTMWPWRDWVIQSFNKNRPYDDFIKLQVAGDLVENARKEDVIATAFLRNQKLNAEGGIVLDEYLMEYAADRTETVSTAFLGLTMQCAKCHDHKYDPISQKEYYEMFSFFNNVNERGMTPNDGNSGPQVLITNEEEDRILDFIDGRIDSLERVSIRIKEDYNPPPSDTFDINLKEDEILSLSFEKRTKSGFEDDNQKGKKYLISGDGIISQGRFESGFPFNAFDYITASNKALNFDNFDPFSFSFWLKVDHEYKDMPLITHLGGKNDNYKGYEIALIDAYPSIRLIHSLPANMIEVRSKEKVKVNEWEHYVFTYSGTGQAKDIKVYRNGKITASQVLLDNLSKSILRGNTSILIGGSRQYQVNVEGRGTFDEVKIFKKALSAVEVAKLFEGNKNLSNRLEEEDLREHALNNLHQPYRKVQSELRSERVEKKKILDTLTTVMVMNELADPRPTFILDRGAYDQKLERVYPNTPKSIFGFDKNFANDRSGLADWLVDSKNPLTARVAVNRIWKIFFDQGIVKTAEDFGNQGSLPHHPELLDYLAVHFVQSKWDVKALIKLIVMSSTYRQSSKVTEEKRIKDPGNELLARGPSHRIKAEFIRDLALSASGLLNSEIGGPSVMPYQPEGLWEEITGNSRTLDTYRQSKGADLYRRSLYTFWRRAAPPPSMTIFDAPSREFCVVDRSQTNTPLQALTLLNDPQFVEAARVLAEKALHTHDSIKDQIKLAYQLLTGLLPSEEIIRDLNQLYLEQSEHFAKHPDLARQLAEIGSHPVNRDLPPNMLAAFTVVCNTMMSFDETIMKR